MLAIRMPGAATNLTRGYDFFATEVDTDHFRRWIHDDSPWLAYFHTMEPHTPYAPEPKYLQRHSSLDKQQIIAISRAINQLHQATAQTRISALAGTPDYQPQLEARNILQQQLG